MLKTLLKMLALITMFSAFGCSEQNTSDPHEAYKLWTGGGNPSKEIHLVHGRYWQSAHWSREYILYLELEASPKWEYEYIRQNNLIYKRIAVFEQEKDAPLWFKPPATCRIYVPKGFNEGSVVYCDSTSNRIFIYEIQL